MIYRGCGLSLTRQCALLGVSRSLRYRGPSGESAENLSLMRRLDELNLAHHLRREGIVAGRHQVYPYLPRDLVIDRPDQVCCADTTYIPVSGGFFYLVAVMDCDSRHVLSWRLSNTMDVGFCIEALEAALRSGSPEIFKRVTARSSPAPTSPAAFAPPGRVATWTTAAAVWTISSSKGRGVH